jgi:chaperone modulatory protein CbpM
MTEAEWPALLAEHLDVALDELVEASGLTLDEVVELTEAGVFEPRGAGPREWRFSARQIVLARQARRLRADFELDLTGLTLALTLMERIEDLEREVHRLRCQLLG